MADSELIIHDITKDVFKAEVYPGDPVPACEKIQDIGRGDSCNVSRLTLGSHSGTHIDAPRHFLPDGKTVEEIDLHQFIGPCTVIEMSGVLDAPTLREAVRREFKRIILKGSITFTLEAAKVLTERGTRLIGVEGLSLGTPETAEEIHIELLKNDVVILESLDMTDIKPGRYYLFTAPMAVGGCDGAPCRAVLFEVEQEDEIHSFEVEES